MKCKKMLALLLAVVMTAAFAGCGDAAVSKDVVAKIDDTTITETQLSEMLTLSAYVAQQDLTQYEQIPELLTMLKKSMLINMVRYEAMRIDLEKNGEEIFPKDYDDKLAEYLKNFKDTAKQIGVSEDTLTYYFNLNYYSLPYQTKAAEAVTDDAVKAYYDANKDSVYTLTAASGDVSHILVADEKTANEVSEKLTGGADFGEMAAQYGTDGTKDVGGSLGTLKADDPNYDADFMKGAFALKSGEISKPIKTQFGYHLIKLENRQEAGTVLPFDDVKENIKSQLASDGLSVMVEELVAKCKVEYLGDYSDDAAAGGAEDGGDDGAAGGGDTTSGGAAE